jgi:glycosyltransferase involved in cell wall biosynthesis
MTPAKILHVFGRMEPGGAEIRLLELIGRLSPAEFQVDVCALSGVAGSLDGDIRRLGGEVMPLALDARFAPRFIGMLRQRRYDVVHSHVLYTSGLILALAAVADVPLRVAHFHATHDGRLTTWRRRAHRRVMRALIDRFATDIVACGEGSMNAVWQPAWRLDPRCRVIYDALDLARFEQPRDRSALRTELGLPAAGTLFVHVGNQTEEKNHQRLIRIFAAIGARDPAARLVLVGAGTDGASGAIPGYIHENGLQDCVIGAGVRTDVPRILMAADALLLPSLREGLPGVVLEACAAGLPVLASDLPGVREIASRLLLVRFLSLERSDQEWAQAALALPAEADALRLRERAAAAFGPSVFHVDRAAEAHRALWRRAIGEGVA